MNFKVSNFGKNNTPAIFHKIGNACLIISAIGGVFVLAPISSPAIATIGAWCAFAGALGKVLCKLAGDETSNETPNIS